MKNAKINSYGYAVFGNGKMPLHIVAINHERLASYAVFSNARDAKDYILREKETLPGLAYDSDYPFCKGIIDVYTNGSAGLFSKIENKQIYKTA